MSIPPCSIRSNCSQVETIGDFSSFPLQGVGSIFAKQPAAGTSTCGEQTCHADQSPASAQDQHIQPALQIASRQTYVESTSFGDSEGMQQESEQPSDDPVTPVESGPMHTMQNARTTQPSGSGSQSRIVAFAEPRNMQTSSAIAAAEHAALCGNRQPRLKQEVPVSRRSAPRSPDTAPPAADVSSARRRRGTRAPASGVPCKICTKGSQPHHQLASPPLGQDWCSKAILGSSDSAAPRAAHPSVPQSFGRAASKIQAPRKEISLQLDSLTACLQAAARQAAALQAHAEPPNADCIREAQPSSQASPIRGQELGLDPRASQETLTSTVGASLELDPEDCGGSSAGVEGQKRRVRMQIIHVNHTCSRSITLRGILKDAWR